MYMSVDIRIFSRVLWGRRIKTICCRRIQSQNWLNIYPPVSSNVASREIPEQSPRSILHGRKEFNLLQGKIGNVTNIVDSTLPYSYDYIFFGMG